MVLLVFLPILVLVKPIYVYGESDPDLSSLSQELYAAVISKKKQSEKLANVKKLVELGANVNFVNVSAQQLENSVLSAAVNTKSFKLVEFLLEAGANPNPVHIYGCTPIGSAIIDANHEIITFLIMKGAGLSQPACYVKSGNNFSAFRTLLISKYVEDDTRLLAIENFATQQAAWQAEDLLRMIAKQKFEVAKRMLELRPEITDKTTIKVIRKSSSEKIRSLLDYVK